MQTLQAVAETEQFRSLVRSRRTVVTLLSFLMISSYFTFIGFLAVSKETFAIPVIDQLPLGIPVGVGLILFAWLLTGVYIYWANTSYDRRVHALKRLAEGAE